MSREEDLKRRYELEDKLKDVIVRSSTLAKRLTEISKELSGIDNKVDLLLQKKSDIPPQQRSNKLEFYTYTGVVLLVLAIIDILLLCSDSLSKFKLIFTIVLIILICIGLWCGYAYWSNSQILKQDIELDEEITKIKNSTNELFNNRANVQNDLEALAFTMSEIIRQLNELTKVK